MRTLIAIVGVLTLVLLLFKLFTAEVRLADDPTVALAIKPGPSMENLIVLGQMEALDQFRILILDENDFVGRPAYSALTGWGWIVLPALILVLGLGIRQFRQSGQRHDP